MKTAKEQIVENERLEQMQGFINSTDWKDASINNLQQDASVRKYFRLRNSNNTAILMDTRPPFDDIKSFEFMQKKLARIEMTVPQIYNIDYEHGFALIEDFGDERYYELVTQKKGDLNNLYKLAVDALVHKYFADPVVALEGSIAYSDEYWLTRVEQFLLHYMPHVLGRKATDMERKDFLGIFKDLLLTTDNFNPVLLHGDFVVQNLYHLPQRAGIKALGLIDFQDMTDARGNVKGSPAFDLVFLLQDVRVDLSLELENSMVKRFIKKSAIEDIESFKSNYAVLGMAQAVKCLGLFSRLGYLDKREEYLKFMPYCLRNIERNLKHSAVKNIKTWFKSCKIELN